MKVNIFSVVIQLCTVHVVQVSNSVLNKCLIQHNDMQTALVHDMYMYTTVLSDAYFNCCYLIVHLK